jgi:hypothetical protein
LFELGKVRLGKVRLLIVRVGYVGRETNHSPPSSAEAENAWSYTSTPHTSTWYGPFLSTGQLYFYLYVRLGCLVSLV